MSAATNRGNMSVFHPSTKLSLNNAVSSPSKQQRMRQEAEEAVKETGLVESTTLWYAHLVGEKTAYSKYGIISWTRKDCVGHN